MPSRGAASTMRRTATAPARWPAARGRARRVAQRPLPSMMIATCGEVLCFIKSLRKKKWGPASALPRDANQRLHMVEVPLQRLAPGGREPVHRLGHTPVEGLAAGDVLRVLELARVDAEVAVARFEQCFQLAEGEALADGERAD